MNLFENRFITLQNSHNFLENYDYSGNYRLVENFLKKLDLFCRVMKLFSNSFITLAITVSLFYCYLLLSNQGHVTVA